MRSLLVLAFLAAAGCGGGSPTAPEPTVTTTPKPIETTCFLIQNGQKIVIPCTVAK